MLCDAPALIVIEEAKVLCQAKAHSLPCLRVRAEGNGHYGPGSCSRRRKASVCSPVGSVILSIWMAESLSPS